MYCWCCGRTHAHSRFSVHKCTRLLGILCGQHLVSPRNLEASSPACMSDCLHLEFSGVKADSFQESVRRKYWESQFCICSPSIFTFSSVCYFSSFLKYIAFQNVTVPHLPMWFPHWCSMDLKVSTVWNF